MGKNELTLSVGVGHCWPNLSSCLLNHYFLPKPDLHAGLCTGLVVHCTSLCSLHNVLFFVPVWKGINLPCRKLFSFALHAIFESMIVEPLLLAEV